MSAMHLGSIWCQCESSVLTLKNDLSQQDLERGGHGTLFDSHQPCADSQRVEEEGIISITHTQIYKYTHQRTNIHIQKAQIHSIRHEKICACLFAQKRVS